MYLTILETWDNTLFATGMKFKKIESKTEKKGVSQNIPFTLNIKAYGRINTLKLTPKIDI